MFCRTNRTWLIAHAWGDLVTAFVSLGIGLRIWVFTLGTHKNLEPIWNEQEEFVQSLLQARFKCCAYSKPILFVKDQTCSTAAIAAQLGSCMVPFGAFANKFLDIVFTTNFGFCAIDALLLLATMCLIKHHNEQKRFRRIDMKLAGMHVL